MPQLSAGESRALELEYIEQRAVVLAMLRSEFAGLRDQEELYQEAWAEALEIQARGGEIVNLGGLLRTIAWRRARDRLRKHRPDTLDPGSQLFHRQPDPDALPEEQVEVRIDAALIRQVVESLEPRQAAAIKLRFDCHLDAREIQRRLGVSPKRLEKIVTEAYQRVESCLRVNSTGTSEWRRRQRSLLLACETGLASARQRRQASAMVREDPVCRAMLHEIRSALEQVAAVLPLPLPLLAAHGRLARRRFDVLDRLESARGQLADLAARLSGRSLTAEQATAGGAATGSGTLVKTVLGCLAVAGGTAVCLPGGVLTRHRPVAPARPAVVAKRSAPARLARPPHPTLPAAPRLDPRRRRITTGASATAPAAASPAPTGSTEFGPGAVGSSTAPSTPSAAPAGGGGEFTP
jgi:RNA polymerase sigma factor (sigma-70 family)